MLDIFFWLVGGLDRGGLVFSGWRRGGGGGVVLKGGDVWRWFMNLDGMALGFFFFYGYWRGYEGI